MTIIEHGLELVPSFTNTRIRSMVDLYCDLEDKKVILLREARRYLRRPAQFSLGMRLYEFGSFSVDEAHQKGLDTLDGVEAYIMSQGAPVCPSYPAGPFLVVSHICATCVGDRSHLRPYHQDWLFMVPNLQGDADHAFIHVKWGGRGEVAPCLIRHIRITPYRGRSFESMLPQLKISKPEFVYGIIGR